MRGSVNSDNWTEIISSHNLLSLSQNFININENCNGMDSLHKIWSNIDKIYQPLKLGLTHLNQFLDSSLNLLIPKNHIVQKI